MLHRRILWRHSPRQHPRRSRPARSSSIIWEGTTGSCRRNRRRRSAGSIKASSSPSRSITTRRSDRSPSARGSILRARWRGGASRCATGRTSTTRRWIPITARPPGERSRRRVSSRRARCRSSARSSKPSASATPRSRPRTAARSTRPTPRRCAESGARTRRTRTSARSRRKRSWTCTPGTSGTPTGRRRRRRRRSSRCSRRSSRWRPTIRWQTTSTSTRSSPLLAPTARPQRQIACARSCREPGTSSTCPRTSTRGPGVGPRPRRRTNARSKSTARTTRARRSRASTASTCRTTISSSRGRR